MFRLGRGDLLRLVLGLVLWVCVCLDTRGVGVSGVPDGDADGSGGATGARGPRGEVGRRTGERIGVGGIGTGGGVDGAVVSVVIVGLAVDFAVVVVRGVGGSTAGITLAVCMRSAVPTRRLSDGPSTPAPASLLSTSGIAARRMSLEGTARLLDEALGLGLAK